MQKFNEPIVNEVTGLPIAQLKVVVQNYPAGTPAVVYNVDDKTATPLTQPLTTNANGVAPFYAANGHYQLVTYPPGGQPAITDFILSDELLNYDIAQYFIGKPTNSQVVLLVPMAHNVTFGAGMTLSKGSASVAATASTTFNIAKNGVNFATMVFAINATMASFVVTVPTAFIAGDVLTVTGPASADATLSNIGFILAGLLNL